MVFGNLKEEGKVDLIVSSFKLFLGNLIFLY